MQHDRRRRSPVSRHRLAGRGDAAPSRRGLAFRAKPAPGHLARAPGRLASDRMAHDLNNLLAVVLSATEVLATDACEGDRKVIAAAGLEAARRAADLLQGFLADEGAADRLETPCSSTDVLRSAALLGAQLLPAGMRLAVQATARPLYCRADRSELESALLNLCKNAGEASLAGGQVVLSATSGDEPGVGGPCVRFEVRDEGVGMSPEILAAARRPYFTTKAAAGGTGLGLASVAAFAKAAGGALRIESEAGRGTRVSLLLPQSTRQAAKRGARR